MFVIFRLEDFSYVVREDVVFPQVLVDEETLDRFPLRVSVGAGELEPDLDSELLEVASALVAHTHSRYFFSVRHALSHDVTHEVFPELIEEGEASALVSGQGKHKTHF